MKQWIGIYNDEATRCELVLIHADSQEDAIDKFISYLGGHAEDWALTVDELDTLPLVV